MLFLYDRSAKLSDSTFYSNNSVDTANYKIWKQVYDEMYYATHDTLPFTKVNTIEFNASQFYSDTIPIGLMDYEYYHLKEEAFSTGDYFIFDTINNYLLDHPNPIGSPYQQSNIFLASPFKEFSSFTNPVFRIDPQFLFSDDINIPLYQGSSNFTPFRIDFGDGSGWQYFDVNTVTHYEADYTSSGNHVITVQLLDKKRMILKSSKSTFTVTSKSKSLPPDYFLEDVEGLSVGVYDGCEYDDAKKVIIFIEGFDLLDMIPSLARGVDRIYNERIFNHNIENLLNFNYTYYVVSWENSRIDLRFNALYVLNLIEKLKTIYADSDEQFVIIGESMGGIVGRYVLSFMESEAYENGDFSTFFNDEDVLQNKIYLRGNPYLYELGFVNRDENLVGLNHKTRELITLDSPHQGANIPLSIQHAYGNILSLLPGSRYITTMFNIGLDSYAAKQMLLYHLNGKVLPNSSVSGYMPDVAHISFYDELNEMGYPEYCKIVALSSGSLQGKNQRNVFDNYRTAGDLLLLSKADLYARIFWIRVPILSYNFNLRTNPNGSGTFYSASLGNFTIKVKLKWFGVKISNTYGNIYSDNQIALDVKPYCVSAGGYKSTGITSIGSSPGSSYSLSDKWLFNLFSYNISSSSGCVELNSHVGWNGFSSTNLDFDLCSDGHMFGFVPLQSSLDYGNGMGMPLNHNILAENINTKLSRTPFDVIIGMPKDLNIEHPQYRDERIFNITGQDASHCSNTSIDGGRFAYYDADLQGKCKVRRGLLCLEIGDEELYLENWKLNRIAKFQTQYALYVNRRNPYYEYPSQSPVAPFNIYKGMYSKEQHFQITNQGYAKFFTNKINSPISNGFDYGFPVAATGLWEKNDEVFMTICLEEYNTKSLVNEGTGNELTKDDVKTRELKLYPNPNNGTLLMIQLGDNFDENAKIEISSISGKIVARYSNSESINGIISIDLKNLQSGMYMVSVKNHENQEVRRLIIK